MDARDAVLKVRGFQPRRIAHNRERLQPLR
jgi:hypothetical protein